MSLTKLLPVILLMMATGVQASTRDEIERLWNPQGMAVQPAQPAADTSARTEKPAPRWFRLSNGRQVNLADWKVVLFMQGHCPYCHQFDPVLKQLAQQYGFSVFPYTLDGQGDTAFPEALPVPPDVMQTFFPNIPVSWMMVKGLGAGFSSVYSHFASSAISPTASAAGSVVDGNYSYGNMQTENVNGFSWSTNSTTSFGQMMYQTGSGATATQTRDGNMVMDASGAMSRLPVGINATRQIAAAQQEMAREASNRAESALHGFSSSIASAWNSLSQFGSNRGSSDSVTGGADSTMSAQDSMMASRMRSAVESYAKAHNISNEQATQELASRSTRASAGMYGDAHAEWGVKPKILGVGGGLGVRGGGRAGIDWEDNDAHTASSNTQSSHNARHDIDARATQDFKEASDYFTSRKVSESGSHTDNNADSRVDQLSAALNSAKQSYDQYTTNMTRSHEYAEMASRTESMSGQMSEDLSQQFAQYVMKHAPQDAEAILTNTSSPEIAERRRAMAWSFVQEQVQPGVDNAWRESRGDIGKGMESVPSGGGSQDIIADHQGHQAIIDQRTQDSNIRNDVKHQVDNMVTEYKGNIGDTQNSVRGEENIVRGQYSELQNHHKTEALSQNNKYNEEKSAQERMPGADSPQELMKRAKEYQDKYKQ